MTLNVGPSKAGVCDAYGGQLLYLLNAASRTRESATREAPEAFLCRRQPLPAQR